MRTDSEASSPVAIDPFTRRQLVCGVSVMGAFCLAMAAWSGLAPLGSAVIAPGIVSVESYRKAIQHLEGGIVGRILVKDGTRVRRGDVLVEMRDVAAVANVDRLKSQYYETLASASRLAAERDGQIEIAFPDALVKASIDEPVAASAMAAQRKIFYSRRDLQNQKLSVLNKKIDRLREEGEGLRKQLEALDTQLALTEQESKDATALYEKQLTRKTRVIEVQRNRALLEERRSGLESSLAQADQQIAELELKKTELLSSTLATVVEDVRARQARAHEISRELIAAQDILTRTQIRAPIDGTIVGLQIYSRDGVIAPGQTLMEIVPLSDTLVVDARVRPEDIEEVRAGLPAQVVLNTLTRRYGKPIDGRLDSVSADRLLDKLSGRAFYMVRVALDPASIDPGDTKLLAGMSADVFIQTGDRTPLAYLAAPILRTLNRGMREN